MQPDKTFLFCFLLFLWNDCLSDLSLPENS